MIVTGETKMVMIDAGDAIEFSIDGDERGGDEPAALPVTAQAGSSGLAIAAVVGAAAALGWALFG